MQRKYPFPANLLWSDALYRYTFVIGTPPLYWVEQDILWNNIKYAMDARKRQVGCFSTMLTAPPSFYQQLEKHYDIEIELVEIKLVDG